MNPFYDPYWKTDKEDKIEHFGILGMKWGIRRFQNKNGTLTAAGKQRYATPPSVSKDATPATILGQSYAKDISIPKGSTAYRVQNTPALNKKSQLYLSFDKTDHVKYMELAMEHPDYGIGIDLNNGENASDHVYSITMKTTKSIKAPSYQHAMEKFVEMVGDKGIDEINPNSKESVAGQWFIDSIKSSTIEDLGPDYAYRTFVDTMRRPNRSEFYREFKQRLAKDGYNALVDPVDRRYEDEGEYEELGFKSSFIVLDPDAISVTSSKKVSFSDYPEWRKKNSK